LEKKSPKELLAYVAFLMVTHHTIHLGKVDKS